MANNKNIKINLDYSEFSNGISDCQRKMGLLTEQFKMQQSALGNNATEVERLALTQSSLSSKIELQIQIVEKASERYKALANSEGASASQVDNAQRSYMKQITTLNNLTNELEQVNRKLEENAQEEEKASNGAANASNGNAQLVMSVANAVTGVTAFVQALKQLGQALIDCATQSTQLADNLATLSSQTGISTQTLQELGYASEFVDVSMETMQGAMTRLTQKMGEVQNGSASAKQAFDDLHISVQNSDGSLRSSEQVFYDVIDALGGISNKAEQDAASMQIFGRSAQQLAGVIDAGSSGLRAYADEANNLGVVMSDSEVQALASCQDSFDKLDAVMEASSNRISASLAPSFAGLADVISNLDPSIIDFANGLGKIGQTTASVIGTANQYVQTLAQLRIAKALTTAATVTESGAEIGLAGSAAMANMAMLPQIMLIGAITAALAALALAIKEAIDLYKEYKETVEGAGEEAVGFGEYYFTDNWQESYGNALNKSSKHYALGGRTSGGRVWVGEQGAELVDLPAGSYVHNSTEVNQMTNGSNVTNITVNVDHISELDDLLRISKQAKQRSRMGVFA